MLTLREIMTKDVLTIAPDLSIREAAEIFSTERLGGAPVVRLGKIVGMLSASDLLDFIASLQAEPDDVSGGKEHGVLENHTVEEAMTRAPLRTRTLILAGTLMEMGSLYKVPTAAPPRARGSLPSIVK